MPSSDQPSRVDGHAMGHRRRPRTPVAGLFLGAVVVSAAIVAASARLDCGSEVTYTKVKASPCDRTLRRLAQALRAYCSDHGGLPKPGGADHLRSRLIASEYLDVDATHCPVTGVAYVLVPWHASGSTSVLVAMDGAPHRRNAPNRLYAVTLNGRVDTYTRAELTGQGVLPR